MRLVATASTRTWVYRYRSPLDQRMRQVKLGRWPAMGLPAAMAAWQKAAEARQAGADLSVERRAKREQAQQTARHAAYTVQRACDEYLATYAASVTSKTYAEAERILRVELHPIAARLARSVTRADAFDLLQGLADRPVLAQRTRQLLGAVWDRALDAGRLPADTPNWWRMVLRGKLPSRGPRVDGENVGVRARALSELELAALLPWLPNFTRDIEDALVLYLWTCCRGAEIVGMQREEITEEAEGLWWTIPRARLKMRRHPLLTDLRVPLVGRAAAVVRRRLAATESAWLFPSRGQTPHVAQKAVGVAVWMHQARCTTRPEWVRPRLPVADWAPHDLRRTGRTLLAALGCPPDVAEAILGHLPPGIQAVYNRHQYDAERRLWLTRLAERLEQLLASQGPAPGR